MAELTSTNTRLIPIIVGFVLLSLCAIRWWPVLLGAGTLLLLPAAMLRVFPDLAPELRLASTYLARGGAIMVFIGTLAAAQLLVRLGRTGAGAVVAGGAIGSQLAAVAFFVAPVRQPRLWIFDTLPEWALCLTLIGLAGAVPAMVVAVHRRTSAKSETDGTPSGGQPSVVHRPADVRPAQRRFRVSRLALSTAVVGTAASAVGIVSLLLTRPRRAALLEFVGLSSAPTTRTTSGVLGAVIVVIGLGMAATLGRRALLAVLTAALAVVAVPAVHVWSGRTYPHDDRFVPAATLAGIALGVAAVTSRHRVQLACSGGIVSAGLLFFVVLTPEDAAYWVVEHPAALTATVLAIVTATVITIVGTISIGLGRLGILPALLGPILGALELGGLPLVSSRSIDPGLDSNAWYAARNVDVSAVLLLASVALLATAELIRRRRQSPDSITPAAPRPTPDPLANHASG